tara:strand:+ start:5787 stop:6443 length:657 start_codon:yes stop_codon:yes gene_type:complete
MLKPVMSNRDTPRYIPRMVSALERIAKYENRTIDNTPYICATSRNSYMLQMTLPNKQMCRKQSMDLPQLIALRDLTIYDVLKDYFMHHKDYRLYVRAAAHIDITCAHRIQDAPAIARKLNQYNPCQHPMVPKALKHLHKMSRMPPRDRRYGNFFLDQCYAISSYFYANHDMLCYRELQPIVKSLYNDALRNHAHVHRNQCLALQSILNAYGVTEGNHG